MPGVHYRTMTGTLYRTMPCALYRTMPAIFYHSITGTIYPIIFHTLYHTMLGIPLLPLHGLANLTVNTIPTVLFGQHLYWPTLADVNLSSFRHETLKRLRCAHQSAEKNVILNLGWSATIPNRYRPVTFVFFRTFSIFQPY